MSNVNILHPKRLIYIFSDKRYITAGCKKCSFKYVAEMLSYYLKKYANISTDVIFAYNPDTLFVITDLWYAVTRATADFAPINAIYWIDTAWVKFDTPIDRLAKTVMRILTTSPWNQQLLLRSGVKADVIPRAIHEEYATKYLNLTNDRKYDFTIIATGPPPTDKKNATLAYKVLKETGELERSFLVCLFDFCNVKPFTLTDDDKYRLLSQTKWFIWLSDSEGFGLPPVEAQSVGTPVIYNASEYVSYPISKHVNIPVNPTSIQIVRDPQIIQAWYPRTNFDFNELVNVFREALRTELTEDDRLELHNYVMRNFTHKVIIPKLIEIAKEHRGII
jgi:glycosyltransferase involved in cell wall biosynthesis